MTTTKRRALLVLGMHRSGTSALTGLIGKLGCDLPSDIMAASDLNAKGFFESNKISFLNEELLASVGLTWFDLRRFPEDWHTSPQAEPFRHRAAEILQEEYGTSDLFVIKDPRVCRLVPFWTEVLEGQNCTPLVVCTHRNPLEVAASLTRADGYEPRYGQILWLRHVLDVEAATRGMPRVFVSYAQLMSNWQQVADRISTGLAFEWPRKALQTASDVSGFLSTDLQHFSVRDESDTKNRLDVPWLWEVYAVMERWAATGEDPADHALLDATRKSLDGASPLVVPVANELRDRVRQIANLRKELNATELELKAAGNDLRAVQHSLDMANIDLAMTRRKPLQNLGMYVSYKVLMALSSPSSPLPARMKSRFRRSTLRRDPKRSLQALSEQAKAVAVAKPRPEKYAGKRQVHPDRKTILIVSHEASRTGAPILALNLAQSLCDRYNVVTLCLRGGVLLENFQASSVSTWITDQPRGKQDYFSALLGTMTEGRPFDFAIVNSIESRPVLAALNARGIPTVALLHEFATYTLPRTAFSEAFQFADHVVFSSSLTLDNALEATGQPRLPKIHVFPQGKCEVPQSGASDEQHALERARIRQILRPAGAEGDFVVVGAGHVQIRKGVDLFIETARKVIASPQGARARFVWIGAGYLPDKDASYSVYIKDQLERTGLGDRVVMVPETSEIEHVYELSDVLLLPSRLDPLPNVGIDAMTAGLPVLCFDKATGIAELLDDAGLHQDCVADYLDTSSLASRVLALAASREEYDRVRDRTKSYADATFSFAAYAHRIEDLALSVQAPPSA